MSEVLTYWFNLLLIENRQDNSLPDAGGDIQDKRHPAHPVHPVQNRFTPDHLLYPPANAHRNHRAFFLSLLRASSANSAVNQLSKPTGFLMISKSGVPVKPRNCITSPFNIQYIRMTSEVNGFADSVYKHRHYRLIFLTFRWLRRCSVMNNIR